MNRLYGNYEGWSGSAASGRHIGPGPEPQDMMEQWQETLQQGLRPVQRWVQRHPGVSLAIAASVGIYIGWLVKRS